jgi:hypothetical protein
MEQKNKNDKASLILETIKKTVLKSKVHGLSNMIRVDSKIMKTIWFFCFFTSMGYCFSQIFISFYHYFHFEVTTIKDIFYEAPAYFPAVDICNLGNKINDNFLNKSQFYFIICKRFLRW